MQGATPDQENEKPIGSGDPYLARGSNKKKLGWF